MKKIYVVERVGKAGKVEVREPIMGFHTEEDAHDYRDYVREELAINAEVTPVPMAGSAGSLL